MSWLVFWVAALGMPVLALAVVGFRHLTRETPVKRVRSRTRAGEAPGVADDLFVPTLQLVTKAWLVDGHDIALLKNGDGTYPRLWDDLAQARRSITMQMYYSQPGIVADRLHAALCERARAGVKVLFLRDAFGSGKLSDEYIERLRAAGVEVATFRPVKWYALDKAYARSHIRVVVIDGALGYTGGFGIDDKWLGDGVHDEGWRDNNVRFTGPAVAQLQATFAAGWAEATGDLLTGSAFFPEHVAEQHDPDARPDQRGATAALLHTAPTIGSTPAERFIALAIASAQRRLWITNPYFVPDEGFIGLLTHAAERGVDVRILTSGERTDVLSALYAGRWAYRALVSAGVRVFEYVPTVLHAKTIVADGLFGAVGTMNFDNRSMAFNDETMLLVCDQHFARTLEQTYEEDLTHSYEWTRDDIARRPFMEKVRERFYWGLRRVL
ncbi:MAG TPA: phospholipase D-like domain-containing protein [Gemmatimonadaceae bacterium]|nr:phospholipase D-like domain-containing protein [Gemmatimonadaceae bacterium]